MIPIPSFNPGDTGAYPNGNGVILVGAADAGSKVLFYNESPYNLQIDFLNGSLDVLHAWEARWWILDGDTKQVAWLILSSLTATTAPISVVMGTLYGPNEQVPGTYPVSLFRQTNIGNSVQTNVNSISNTTNAPGSNWLNVQPTDAASPTFSADNSGNLTINSDNGGALTSLLKLVTGASPSLNLAASTVPTKIFGHLGMQSGTTVSLDNGDISTDGSGNMSFNSGALKTVTIQTLSAGNVINIKDGSTLLAQISASNGLTLYTPIFFQNVSAPQTLTNGSTISISGTNFQSIVYVQSSAAVTGIILPKSTLGSQFLIIDNVGSFSITMASPSIGNTSGGTNDVMNPGRPLLCIWNGSVWASMRSA